MVPYPPDWFCGIFMSQPILPNASQLALLVSLLIQRYITERGKDISRFRLARNSLRRLAVRARLKDTLVDEWVDHMALEYGWIVFIDAEEFLLIRKDITSTWTKIATKRCDDLIRRLRAGDVSVIDDAEVEFEPSPEPNEEDE
ncbi:hypothetical protein [Acetobacter indonesiensis]|uniref:hypothetical protein n=1 Tax=Acetobacter indonesiensis TaxID=104101 RepID=UPI0039E73467